MKRRTYRLIFFTLPLTVLLLWLAAGQFATNQLREHREGAAEVARGLAIAVQLYVEDHHGFFPPADRWEEDLRPYLGTVPLTVPRTQGAYGRRYAMNRALTGRKLAEIAVPAKVIVFYESTSGAANATDDFTSLIPANDPDRLILVYADGHTEDNSNNASIRERAIRESLEALKSRR